MNYKHKVNGVVQDTAPKGKKPYKLYPKIKDTPTPLVELPENATQEQVENIRLQNEEINYNNIEYMVKEYE